MAQATAIAVTPQTQTPTDIEIDTSAVTGLQEVTQPLELRIYCFSTATDARWCRAGLRRKSGEDLVVTGYVKTAEPPRASIGLNEGLAVIRWPDAPGWRVQSTTNIAEPAAWADWSGPITSAQGNGQATVSPDDPFRFFRCVQP